MSEKVKRYLTRETPGIEVVDDGKGSEYLLKNNWDVRGEAWKLDVGAECNHLLELAEHLDEVAQAHRVGHSFSGDTIRSIVRRVAEFEDLEETP